MAQKGEEVRFTGPDRAQLESLIRKGSIPQNLAQRTYYTDESRGATSEVIATRVGLSETVVHKWRRRFREEGIAGLRDRHRPGQPRKLSEIQIQALDRTQPMLPLKPGQIERRTHDYKRHGTTNLYAAFDILTGEVRGRITKRHRTKESLDFLKQFNRSTDSGLELHIILDNSSTHKTEEVRAWLLNHQRFHLHFTPTSSSWLNAVERWFAQLEHRCLYRGLFSSVSELQSELRRYTKAHNQESAKPFRWTKDAQTIIDAANRAKTKINDFAN